MTSMNPMIEKPHGDIPIGAGTMLRAAREAQGLHIAMLAVSLKVPVKKLEALEAEQYDLLPDMVFARALASSVCRALKIDATPVLAALPRSHFPKIKTDESGLNATFNDSVSGSGSAMLSQLRKPLGISILLLIVGIIAIVFLPLKSSGDRLSTELSKATLPVASVASVVSVEASPQSAVTASLPSSAVSLTLTNSMTDTLPTGPGLHAQPPVSNTSASIVAVSSGMAMVANSEGILTLQARGSSWVEVVDAKGVLQLRKTLTKDEIVSVSGALPLVVVLGRADSVSVAIRGQPFDTAPMSTNNVARFEVK